MSEQAIWHDEMDRLAAWRTLDPPDACMCRDCVLGPASSAAGGARRKWYERLRAEFDPTPPAQPAPSGAAAGSGDPDPLARP